MGKSFFVGIDIINEKSILILELRIILGNNKKPNKKMKNKISLICTSALVAFLGTSCSELDVSYRKTLGAKVHGQASSYPGVSKTSSISSKTNSLRRSGYEVLGSASLITRKNYSSDDIRAFAQSKGADMAIYSKGSHQTRTATVAVPVETTVSNSSGAAASRYGNNYGYQSGTAAKYAQQTQSTTYQYQTYKYKVQPVQVSLFVRRSRLTSSSD